MSASSPTHVTQDTSVAAIAIGRNEGERLRRCLASLVGTCDRIVYVDSGSTDNSLEIARAAGVEIVELDRSKPFSAARGRNEGFAALVRSGRPPTFVQFVDGDCAVEPGWIAKGTAVMLADPGLGLVAGIQSEVNRDATVYNQLCDFEWHRPPGPIDACGGNMLVRCDAFKAVGGFIERLVAGEDEEFCFRLQEDGWRLERLPVAMTRHDAAMHRFGQWWRRTVRTGHAYAHVGAMHPSRYVAERARIVIFGLLLPTIALLGMRWSPYIPLAVAALYGLSYVRTVAGLRHAGLPMGEALTHAGFLSLSKLPQLIGMATYFVRQIKGRRMELIEYK